MNVFLTTILVLMPSFISAQNLYGLSYLAEQLDQYCKIAPSNRGHNGPPSGSNQVRVGKAGPRGWPGPPGIVDYDAINEKISEKMQDFEGSLLRKVSEKLRFVNLFEEKLCQVRYNGNCFWLMATSRMNYETGKDMCASMGAHPANIYSVEHYTAILRYAQKQIPAGSSMMEPWLGMTFDSSRNVAVYYNGSDVDYAIPWHPTFPFKAGSRSQLNLSTRPDVNNKNQGVWNIGPSSIEDGVICEI